jgi:hypothetical protein
VGDISITVIHHGMSLTVLYSSKNGKLEKGKQKYFLNWHKPSTKQYKSAVLSMASHFFSYRNS